MSGLKLGSPISHFSSVFSSFSKTRGVEIDLTLGEFETNEEYMDRMGLGEYYRKKTRKKESDRKTSDKRTLDEQTSLNPNELTTPLETEPGITDSLETHETTVCKQSFQCDLCPVTTTSTKKLDYLVHLRKYHAQKDTVHKNIYDCCFCEDIFTRKQAYHEHLAKVHVKNVATTRRFMICACPSCGKLFTNRSNLNRHLENTHSASDETFTCNFCERQYKSKLYLKKHIRIMHLNASTGPLSKKVCEIPKTKQVHCDLCGKKFNNAKQLDGHKNACSLFLHKDTDGEETENYMLTARTMKDTIKSTRKSVCTTSDSYTCHFCGKTFGLKGSIYNHITQHHLKRPVQKSICGLCGASVIDMKAHLFVHSRERPFSCEMCGSTFKKANHLKTHCLVHTGERPHVCPVCDKAFTQRGDMYRHAEHVHKYKVPRKNVSAVSGVKVDSSMSKLSNQKNATEIENLIEEYTTRDVESSILRLNETNTEDFILQDTIQYDVQEHVAVIVKTDQEEYKVEFMNHFSGNYRTTEHFVCDLCNATFLKKLQLVRHISWYHPETCDALDPSERRGKLFTCYICTYSNVDKKQLYHQHLREAHNENASSRPKGKLLQLYTCNVCGKLFKSKYLLKTHSWTHSTNEKQFRCDVPDCNAKFKLGKYLAIHKKNIHKINPHPNDPQINEESSTEDSGQHVCFNCGKVFFRLKSLTGHLGYCGTYVNLNGGPKKCDETFACDVCDREFSTIGRLNDHKRRHTEKHKQMLRHYARNRIRTPQMCPECVKYLDKHRHSAHWNLNGGQSEIHLEQATAICTHCAETSTASNGECPANCSSCGKTFLPIKEEFAESSAHCHPNISVETSNSDTCSKLVKTSNSDTCSRKSVKTNGDTWFEQTETMCDLCSKIFPSNDLLRKHKANVHRVKSGKKYDRDYFRRLQPKMCPQCGKSVKNLANHLKLHSGEKFQCSHCAKAFGRVDYLKIHLRIHTGERPYVCYLCGLGFKQHGDMNKHIRAVHKLDPVIRKD
ncbi:hypothetical protein M8J75_010468 [Diaphorina citri]|nr:hypothetical protein M8J75_010468 [Diaphorina citri]